MFLLLATFAALACSTSSAPPHEPTTFACPKGTSLHATPHQVRAAMEDFAHLFYTIKDVPKAFDTYVAENYIQHNADILSGRENAIEALDPLFSSQGHVFEVKRLTVGHDQSGESMAIMHLEATTTSGNATMKTDVVDMYRLQGTCVVEHWDVLQQESANASNPLAYF